jgi:peptidoglycan/LPS O-acetylase OafA/YrhL
MHAAIPAANRILTVEGLRGLAALLVVFDHTVGNAWGLSSWSQQNHGITVFALLTGFLLSRKFLAARVERGPRPSTLEFLRTRAARVYPGYWVALAGAAAAIGLSSMGSGDVLRVLTLTQTLDLDTPFEGLPPTWSLSLFLSFYLALPAWSWWRARGEGRALDDASLLRREVLWLLGLVVLAGVLRSTSALDGVTRAPEYVLPGRLDWFAMGMILAAVVVAQARGLAPRVVLALGRRPGLALLGALALAVGSALVPLHLQEVRNQLDTAGATLLVAGVVLHGAGLRGAQRAFASRPARAIGRWSYGIFLWGFIVQKAILEALPGIPTGPHLLLTMAAAIVLGAASWRLVERPSARLVRRLSTPRRRPGAALVGRKGQGRRLSRADNPRGATFNVETQRGGVVR